MKTEVQVYEGDGTQRREPLALGTWSMLKTGDRLYADGGLFAVVIKTYISVRSGYEKGARLIQAATPQGRRVTIREGEWASWSVVRAEGYSVEDTMFGEPLTRETALKLQPRDVVYRRALAGNHKRDALAYWVVSVGVFMGSTKKIRPDHRLKWEFERGNGKRFWVWQEELFAYTKHNPRLYS